MIFNWILNIIFGIHVQNYTYKLSISAKKFINVWKFFLWCWTYLYITSYGSKNTASALKHYIHVRLLLLRQYRVGSVE